MNFWNLLTRWNVPKLYTKMKTITITRTKESSYQTLGILQFGDFSCKTLELPWKNNERRVSRIPSGEYECVPHQSPKFGDSLWVQDVPNRSEILIHLGNYYRDTLGCILVGREFLDIDGDGHLDVTASRSTMTELYRLVQNESKLKLIIHDKF